VQLVSPVALAMLDPLLEPLNDRSVDYLNLTVPLRAIYGGEVELNTKVFAHLIELSSCELGPIVGDDVLGCPESTYDVLVYKLDSRFLCYFGHVLSFYPLCEVVNCHEYEPCLGS